MEVVDQLRLQRNEVRHYPRQLLPDVFECSNSSAQYQLAEFSALAERPRCATHPVFLFACFSMPGARI
jgi:hypothetical protein